MPTKQNKSEEEKRSAKAAYMREFNRKNKDRLNDARRARNAENKAQGVVPAKRHYTEAQKQAARDRAKKWNADNPERYAANMKSAPSHTPEENRKRAKQWKKDNPEKRRVQGRKFYYDHLEKHRTDGVVNSQKRRAKDHSLDGDYGAAGNLIRKWRGEKTFTCYYCGCRFPIDMLETDHKVPVCEGGAHDPSNLVKSCGPCNKAKGRKLTPQ